jgi:hypothetical protein
VPPLRTRARNDCSPATPDLLLLKTRSDGTLFHREVEPAAGELAKKMDRRAKPRPAEFDDGMTPESCGRGAIDATPTPPLSRRPRRGLARLIE